MFSRLLTAQHNKSFFLFGPRGVGKTSWLRSTFKNALYFDLLESGTYSEILANPNVIERRIPSGYTDWVILDEVQRVPQILNEVHRLIESKKIKFILTGSSARSLRKKGVNLLAGRALTKFMHPLTVAELGNEFSLKHSLQFGTLPPVYTEQDVLGFLKSYVNIYLREEVLQEGLTRNIANFARFLETVTFSQAEVLNMAEVAREAMVSTKVVQDYFSILEDLLLAIRLPVFSKRAKRKLVTHPKFFLFDCGVFNTIRPRGPLDNPQVIPGASVETLFFQQVRAINDYNGHEYQMFYWRSTKQEEVDLVLYGPSGIIAFELKHGNKLRTDDLTSLQEFKKDYPEARCYLVNLGDSNFHENGVDILTLEYALNNIDSILRNKLPA